MHVGCKIVFVLELLDQEIGKSVVASNKTFTSRYDHVGKLYEVSWGDLAVLLLASEAGFEVQDAGVADRCIERIGQCRASQYQYVFKRI